MLNELLKAPSTPEVEIKVAFENWPAPSFDNFTQRLSALAKGPENHPDWDRFPGRAIYRSVVKIGPDGFKRKSKTYAYPVQGPLDFVAGFHRLKPCPSRVGYKSLVLSSCGNVTVAFGPLILEHTCIYASEDETTPRTIGTARFNRIFLPDSADPLLDPPMKLALISVENALVDLYPNLPPFDDFIKYARYKVGSLILDADAYFHQKNYNIQFKPATLDAARRWKQQPPGYVDHKFINNRKLTPARCGTIVTDFLQYKRAEADRIREKMKRLRDEEAREQRRGKRIYRRR